MSRDFSLDGITPELLAKYDRPGPRYTSYPTAPHFHEGTLFAPASTIPPNGHRGRLPLEGPSRRM